MSVHVAAALSERIAALQAVQAECEAEAKIVRKIAADLITQASDLENTAQYHDRDIAMLQARLRDEEAKL